MPTQRPGTLALRDDREADHNVLPDFAWAVAGGGVVLAACVLTFTLTVTWGGMRLGVPMPDGSVAPISTYTSELAAMLMAGFLVVPVTGSISGRIR